MKQLARASLITGVLLGTISIIKLKKNNNFLKKAAQVQDKLGQIANTLTKSLTKGDK